MNPFDPMVIARIPEAVYSHGYTRKKLFGGYKSHYRCPQLVRKTKGTGEQVIAKCNQGFWLDAPAEFTEYHMHWINNHSDQAPITKEEIQAFIGAERVKVGL